MPAVALRRLKREVATSPLLRALLEIHTIEGDEVRALVTAEEISTVRGALPNNLLLSAALFLSAPQPPAQASQRFAASIVGAPSPAHCRSRNQTPRAADWDMQAKGLAASTLDSLSHVYANSA